MPISMFFDYVPRLIMEMSWVRKQKDLSDDAKGFWQSYLINLDKSFENMRR